MSFPRYPEYKDSGIEWLGEVPTHWEVKRIKWSTKSCKNGIWGSDPKGDENDIVCIRVADFDRQRMRVELNEPTYRNVTPKELEGRLVTKGDLLLEKSGGGEKQPVGFVVLYEDPEPAVCANFVAKMELASGMSSSFWRYVHAAGYSIGLNVPSIKQTSGIQNLDQQSYLDEKAAFPPEDEQAVIAAFLDFETTRIDALIEEQQRLIELLKEKHQAVISHAVTNGLDPDVPMMDSGVEWLGEVPAHWSLKRLRYVAELNPSKSEVRSFPGDTEVSFIPMESVGEDGSLDLKQVRPLGEVIGGYTYVRDGDVTFAKITPCFENGKAALMNGLESGVGFGTTELTVLRPEPEQTRGDYLFRVIHSEPFRVLGESHMYGAGGQKRVPDDFARDFQIAWPPKEEQQVIAAFLDHETARIDALVDEAKQGISLLQERRSALISAAVTGKIDVRGWRGESKDAEAELPKVAEPGADYSAREARA